MKYQLKMGISKKEYDKFVKSFSNTSFMQTSSWADVKSAWENDLVGMYENNKLVCSALILKRKLFLGKKLFYIPRGFVIDYSNKKLLKEFVNNLKSYAKKNNGIVIKIDPFVALNQDNIENVKKNKDVFSRKTYMINNDLVMNNLKECGFVHGGFKKEVNAYIQPRYTLAISLKNEKEEFYNKENLRRTFPKNTRNYIGSYQDVRGVEFSFSKNKDDVSKLVSVLKHTEKRQHIALRNESYFKKVMECFPDNAVLFFANINIDKYISFLEEDVIKNPNKKEFCDKQKAEALEVKEKYGNNPLVGATIVMMPVNEKGIKTASFLYAGTNTEILPSLKVTNGLMYYRLCYALDNGCDYCDLGGVDGSLNDHLTTFKSKFNPDVVELVGEFNLVISKFWFGMFNIAMKTLKFIRSKR